MMYWGNGMGGWGMVLMTTSGLLFWGLLIAVVVLLVRFAGRGQLGAVATPTPQQVLADRFAGGQIDEDEYTAACTCSAATRRPAKPAADRVTPAAR